MSESIAWLVISILPIALFFALFAIFGGMSFTNSTKNVKSNSITKINQILLYVGLAKFK